MFRGSCIIIGITCASCLFTLGHEEPPQAHVTGPQDIVPPFAASIDISSAHDFLKLDPIGMGSDPLKMDVGKPFVLTSADKVSVSDSQDVTKPLDQWKTNWYKTIYTTFLAIFSIVVVGCIVFYQVNPRATSTQPKKRRT
jgi:hypothetical protein